MLPLCLGEEFIPLLRSEMLLKGAVQNKQGQQNNHEVDQRAAPVDGTDPEIRRQKDH